MASGDEGLCENMNTLFFLNIGLAVLNFTFGIALLKYDDTDWSRSTFMFNFTIVLMFICIAVDSSDFYN